MTLKSYQLLLFDLDDTLLDFGRFWDRGIRGALGSHALTCDLDVETTFTCFQTHSQLLWDKYEQNEISFDEYRHQRFVNTMLDFNREADDDMVTQFNELFAARGLDSVTVDARMVQLISQLKNQYLVGIVTNSATDTHEKLKRMGVADLFPQGTVYISTELGVAKPDPQIYQLALEGFGIPADATLFIGDSWCNDVVGPMNAGMDAVWINVHGAPVPDEPHPIAVIQHVSQLPQILVGHQHEVKPGL